MRGKFDSFPPDFDEYMIMICLVCSKVVSASNGMSSSFLYESAKDVLRWHDLSVKEHINTVMAIGRLINLPKDQFEQVLNENEYIGISKEDLAKMYS